MPSLTRESEQLSVTNWDWQYLLRLAKVHGYSPIGQSRSKITNNDAQALVAALEKALPEIPEICTLVENEGISGLPDDPLDWFSGERRHIVTEAIAFCDGGGFLVE